MISFLRQKISPRQRKRYFFYIGNLTESRRTVKKFSKSVLFEQTVPQQQREFYLRHLNILKLNLVVLIPVDIFIRCGMFEGMLRFTSRNVVTEHSSGVSK